MMGEGGFVLVSDYTRGKRPRIFRPCYRVHNGHQCVALHSFQTHQRIHAPRRFLFAVMRGLCTRLHSEDDWTFCDHIVSSRSTSATSLKRCLYSHHRSVGSIHDISAPESMKTNPSMDGSYQLMGSNRFLVQHIDFAGQERPFRDARIDVYVCSEGHEGTWDDRAWDVYVRMVIEKSFCGKSGNVGRGEA